MSSASEINLIDIGWPVSLLKCNNELIRMKHGDKLDVLVDDPEVANALMLIIDHSEDHSARLLEQNGHIRITITRP